jgi:hypothetical protein
MMRFVLPFLPVAIFILILILLCHLPLSLRGPFIVFFLIAHAALQIYSLLNWRRRPPYL